MNRRGLYDFCQKSLELAASMQQKGLVIYGDLDGLKSINDNFGHEAGDKAIIAIATIMSSITITIYFIYSIFITKKIIL